MLLSMYGYSGIRQDKIMLPVEVIAPDLFFPVQNFSFDSFSTVLSLADLNWVTDERRNIFS